MRKASAAIRLCLVLLFGPTLFAQTGATSPAPPTPGITTLRTSARAVVLDLVVTDRSGHPVRGLKASDLTVFEDGQPQTVASFEVHDAASQANLPTAAQHAAPGPNTFTNETIVPAAEGSTVVLLDLLDTPLTAQPYARDQLIKYLKTMQPGVRLAIFELDSDLHLLQGFTSDRAALLEAVKDRDKLGRTAVPLTNAYVAGTLRMDILTHALQNLGAYLQTLPGRKNLVWFTARVPRPSYDDGTMIGGSIHDSIVFDYDFGKAAELMKLGQVAIYPVDVRGLVTDPSFNAASSRGPSARSSQRFSTQQFYDHSDLEAVAEATGGKAFYNTNGLSQALGEVVEDGSYYYTLSYYPTTKKWDGSFRKVKLELDRKDATLEYRRGYYGVAESQIPRSGRAPSSTPHTQITNHATVQAFARTMQLGAIDPGAVRFEVHVAASPEVVRPGPSTPPVPDNALDPKHRDQPYRLYKANFHLMGDQIALAADANGLHTGSVEFVALLFDDQGALINQTSASVNMTLLPATYDRVMKVGMDMPVQLQVPVKGSYFFRFGIHDLAANKAGAVEAAVGRVQLGLN
jgi:VWFA-related protein